jgi:endoribonuclease Dicer
VTKNQNLTPGQITDMRSALVNNNNLADIAVRNGLQKHLLQQSPELFKRIGDYVIDHDSTLENETENTANGKISAYDHNMERYNGEECPVFEQIEVPKALGDLVESLIGATWIQTVHNLKIVWHFTEKLFGDQLKRAKSFKLALSKPRRVPGP